MTKQDNHESISIDELARVTGGNGCGNIVINNNNGSGSQSVGSDAIRVQPGAGRPAIPNNDRWT